MHLFICLTLVYEASLATVLVTSPATQTFHCHLQAPTASSSGLTGTPGQHHRPSYDCILLCLFPMRNFKFQEGMGKPVPFIAESPVPGMGLICSRYQDLV